jgi:PST family polysaccharide transporter
MYVGPAGYTILGQFQNIFFILGNLAGGIYSSGVVKLTAEYQLEHVKQNLVWKTAIRISLISSAGVGIIILSLKNNFIIDLLYIQSIESVKIIIILGLTGLAISNILLSIVNGKKLIIQLTIINVVSSIFSVIITCFCTYYYGVNGAITSIALNPYSIIIVAYIILKNKNQVNLASLWGRVENSVAKDLFGFGLMGLVTALMAPITLIYIRGMLTDKFGLQLTGLWQATWKISEVYLMLITGSLSAYYLPKIAELKNNASLKNEIYLVYKILLPVTFISALLIYLLRESIVNVIFTENFHDMVNIISWQLAGDFLKIGSWVLSYIMIGRKMVKYYILTEVIFSILFILLVKIFINQYGLQGATMAYFANYLIYWIVIAILINKSLKIKD